MKKRITLERTYDAPLEDVWEMWTTKEGIESWWGPDGFRVEVSQIDLRPGGELHYTMIAVGAEQIAFMQKAGMSVRVNNLNRFTEITPLKRLAYTSLVDFVPGKSAYDVETVVELEKTKQGVRLVLTFDAMHDSHWTQMATMGWENELGKLDQALASASRGRGDERR